jgi:two-component system OmpR family response regulator
MMKNRTIEVLVVDDEPEVGRQVQQALGHMGYRVDTAASPQLALELNEKRPHHILIFEPEMMETSGFDMLSKLREKDRDLAALVLTKQPSKDAAVVALRAGVMDWLEKPVEITRMRAAVERIINSKGLMRDPEDALLKSVGARVRTERKGKGLTLKQLGKRTGLSVSLLSQIERAESAASVSSLCKIASALGTRLQVLFEGY